MGVSARQRAQGRVRVQGLVSGNKDVTVHTRARTGLECVSVDAKAFHLRMIGKVDVGSPPQAKK